MPDAERFAVDPIEAIEFLRQKSGIPTRAWTDIWEDMHSRAFVVAGARDEALVRDFHDAVNRAIAEGRTLEQFRTDFDQIVGKYGWSYHGSRNWRSRVIFETNLRTAYSAGRWEQIQRVKAVRPFLRYVHADPLLQGKYSRPEHAAWHDTVLPVDHPWWLTHFTPNGWGCRCLVQSLNRRDLDRYGLDVSDEPPPSPLEAKVVNTPDGPITVLTPRGIDPGFGYNPGMAAFGRGPQNLALERHGRFEALQAPGAPVVDLDAEPLPLDRASAAPLRSRVAGEAELRASLREALGGDDLVVDDPTGARVLLGQAIVDHLLEQPSRQDGRARYFPLMPELIRDPAEIWVGFARNEASGRVALRRRYVKIVDLGAGRAIGLVADADGRVWSGLTFFRGSRSGAKGLRSGLRVYRR